MAPAILYCTVVASTIINFCQCTGGEGGGGGGTFGIVSRCTQNRPQASRGVYDIDLAPSLLPQ